MARDSRRKYQPYRRKEAGRFGSKVLVRLVVLAFLVSLAAGFGALCYEVLGQSDFFQIAAIDIAGCQRISKKEILELSGVDVHSNLVKINSGQIKEALEQHQWIERVVIGREWPDRLTIAVKERRPVAMVLLPNGFHYVDRAANIFAPVAPAADMDYPVITGLAGSSLPLEMETTGLAEALLLIKYADRDNPNLPGQNISEINIGKNGMVLFLIDRPFPIRLGRGDIWEKYERLTKVLYWLYKRKEFDQVAYIHVDYADDKVLVGMGAG